MLNVVWDVSLPTKMSNLLLWKKEENAQCCAFVLNWLFAVSLSIKFSNSNFINFHTILTWIQRSRIFFNQTSKQLVFIERPFGVRCTIGFLCWFRMLLLAFLVFIFGQITISSELFSHTIVLTRGCFPFALYEGAGTSSLWERLVFT